MESKATEVPSEPTSQRRVREEDEDTETAEPRRKRRRTTRIVVEMDSINTDEDATRILATEDIPARTNHTVVS